MHMQLLPWNLPEVHSLGKALKQSSYLVTIAEVLMKTGFDHEMGFLRAEESKGGKLRLLTHPFLKVSSCHIRF